MSKVFHQLTRLPGSSGGRGNGRGKQCTLFLSPITLPEKSGSLATHHPSVRLPPMIIGDPGHNSISR